MDFFEDSSVSSIAEAHVIGISKIENSEAQRIMKYYSEVRQQLRDRLDTLGEGTFTAQRLRGVLTQVELAIGELSNRLIQQMQSTVNDAALMGVEDLVEEINKWDEKFLGAITPINLNALVVATDASNFLFNRYQSSMEQYNSILRTQMAQILTNAVLEGVNLSDVVGKVSKVFMGEEWRVHRLVRTEIHNVYNVGKIMGMRETQKTTMPDLMKTLFHKMDHRTGEDSIRLEKNNPIVPVDEPFIEYSTGRKLTYMNPPNRPNDRAILIPYRKAWES